MWRACPTELSHQADPFILAFSPGGSTDIMA
jgi:hypothetical protein